MASEEWLKKRYKMEAMVQHMSSNIAAHPPGELPPYVPPDKPSSPWEPGKSPAPSRKLAQGPDYIGDKKTYGKLDRILNPLGDFKKPTLDQLKIHAANYPKA